MRPMRTARFPRISQVGQVDLETRVEQEEQHAQLGGSVSHDRDARRRDEEPVVERRRNPPQHRRAQDDAAEHFPHDSRLFEAPHHLAEHERARQHGGQLQPQLHEILRAHLSSAF